MTSDLISKDILTVATVGYLPQALATLRSAREAGHYSTMHVFVLDAAVGSISMIKSGLDTDTKGINVFGPENLDGETQAAFLRTFKYYSPFEASCLAKYVGVSYVLQHSKSADRCVFSDSDVLFLSDTKEAIRELGNRAILLTPHQLRPSNDATEHDFLLNGWINAGFFIVNRENAATADILNWLIHRISRRGYVATEYGLFCDQAWVSLLPGIFAESVIVSRLAGYNVAYWNLAERHLQWVEGLFKVNGEPLIFFHFSGFYGAAPGQLTKHGDFPIPTGSVLQQLCKRYQHLLAEYASLDMSMIPRLSCSGASLKERIAVGNKINAINIEAPTIKRGLFAKVGGKVDLFISQIIKYTENIFLSLMKTSKEDAKNNKII